jgi:hypothetical protein
VSKISEGVTGKGRLHHALSLGQLLTGLGGLLSGFGFAPTDLAQLQANAFQAALIPAATRAELLTELDRFLAHTVNNN